MQTDNLKNFTRGSKDDSLALVMWLQLGLQNALLGEGGLKDISDIRLSTESPDVDPTLWRWDLQFVLAIEDLEDESVDNEGFTVQQSIDALAVSVNSWLQNRFSEIQGKDVYVDMSNPEAPVKVPIPDSPFRLTISFVPYSASV